MGFHSLRTLQISRCRHSDRLRDSRYQAAVNSRSSISFFFSFFFFLFSCLFLSIVAIRLGVPRALDPILEPTRERPHPPRVYSDILLDLWERGCVAHDRWSSPRECGRVLVIRSVLNPEENARTWVTWSTDCLPGFCISRGERYSEESVNIYSGWVLMIICFGTLVGGFPELLGKCIFRYLTNTLNCGIGK